jgi:hypothetical protein
MKRIRLSLLLLAVFILLSYGSALAQNYAFRVDQKTVHAYWNEDGTLSLDYVFVFSNEPFASPIDFVDVGLPNDNYVRNSVFADINGNAITDITDSPYVSPGIALGLGVHAIQPGETGVVHVFIGTVRDVLHTDTTDDNYASAVFSPTWFDSQFVRGATDMVVTFHLPPGVQPEEPRWHQAPQGFPESPETGFDEEGRIIYTWRNANADASRQYLFGASFPKEYVPAAAIVRPDPFAWVRRISFESLFPLFCFGFFLLIIVWGVVADRNRKLQYLPPKVSIEGHGIKRGLTAIEAAILLEQPMDKILTMILFAVIKKNAARVLNRDPLELQINRPEPPNLHPYEKEFLEAFSKETGVSRRVALQKTMVSLVKSVSQKMKGFSRRETIAYYRDIIQRAWAQVEAAGTPEVKSEKYDEVMEWTMLDRDYDRRTREVFHGGPVFIPMWWPRYDPGFGRATPRTSGAPTQAPTTGSGRPSLPHLPGSDFAAAMVTGVQNFSSNVIGNLSDFTSGVTKVTNPPPPPSTSRSGRSGGGGGCACACACAGCACACAGGGR